MQALEEAAQHAHWRIPAADQKDDREGALVAEVRPRFEPNDLWFSWTTLRHLGRASMKRFLDDPALSEKLKPELKQVLLNKVSTDR